MKKSPSDQSGFAGMLLVLIIVIILAIIGGVGWYIYTRDEEPMGSTDISETESEEASDLSFSGDYFDAIGRGSPLQCTWRAGKEAGGEQQVGEGTFYTDGKNRGYSEATFQHDGTSVPAYAIFDAEYVYTWMQIPGAGTSGTRMSRAAIETAGDDLPEAEQQQALDIRASYSFDCESWTVDESLFTPPADVTFQDVST